MGKDQDHFRGASISASRRDIEEHVKDLEDILSEGHVNIYMFVGGTNFGFMNGSNYYDVLAADVTSYDYDTLLTEDEQITPKYEAFKEVIGKYTRIPEVTFTTKITRKGYGTLKECRSAGLFDNLQNLAKPVTELHPCSMEKLGQGYGYILYESALKWEGDIERIWLYGANDRANIFMDEKNLVTLYDRELLSDHIFESPVKEGENTILIFETEGKATGEITLCEEPDLGSEAAK